MRYTRQIPEQYKHLVKNRCWRCGAFPVIEESVPNSLGEHNEYLTCPNEECYNYVNFDIRINETIDNWNEHNEPKYIPKNKYKELNNCNNFIHKNTCIFARQFDEFYLADKVCDDFKKY